MTLLAGKKGVKKHKTLGVYARRYFSQRSQRSPSTYFSYNIRIKPSNFTNESKKLTNCDSNTLSFSSSQTTRNTYLYSTVQIKKTQPSTSDPFSLVNLLVDRAKAIFNETKTQITQSQNESRNLKLQKTFLTCTTVLSSSLISKMLLPNI